MGEIIIERMDMKAIRLAEQSEPNIVCIRKADGFFLNTKFSSDFRLRAEVYERLKRAQAHLPQSLHFMIFEAYRPRARQIKMWEAVQTDMRAIYPNLHQKDFIALCETFIANPYNGIGSGHQTGCAIDLTLCNSNGAELDMGTTKHEFNALTRTSAEGLTDEVRKSRNILLTALQAEGFTNYPAEWWHFSYGDHQWAFLTGKPEALYGPLDLPAMEGKS